MILPVGPWVNVLFRPQGQRSAVTWRNSASRRCCRFVAFWDCAGSMAYSHYQVGKVGDFKTSKQMYNELGFYRFLFLHQERHRPLPSPEPTINQNGRDNSAGRGESPVGDFL